MTYSSAVFKSDDEDLRTVQMRKISLLIDKARIEKYHEVLEIGCGWETLAIEVVRRTGCKYTGITLSIEQLKYAEEKVKEAGLQDQIKFELCDYRQLSDANKYDRIRSCEMLEAVGHEFMEMFFTRCEAALAENGLMVMTSMVRMHSRKEWVVEEEDIIRLIFSHPFLVEVRLEVVVVAGGRRQRRGEDVVHPLKVSLEDISLYAN